MQYEQVLTGLDTKFKSFTQLNIFHCGDGRRVSYNTSVR